MSVIGSMGWYPSRSAAERLLTRLWTEVKRRVPTAICQVIGWDARSALRGHLGLPDVTIEENVPDTRPYFERSGVLLYAPARGSGMKVKVLEALAYGVPVVTTSEGVEGLPAVVSAGAGVAKWYPPELADLLLPDPDGAADLADRLGHWRAGLDDYREKVEPFSAALRDRRWDHMTQDILTLAENPR